MQPAKMLVTHTERRTLPDLPLDLKASLLRVSIPDMRIHRGEIEQHSRRYGETCQNIGKHRRAGLRGREADAQLLQIAGRNRVPRRKQSVGQRPQRDTVVEQSVAPANQSMPRGGWRPRESGSGRNVAGAGCNAFK